ncbi:hypothetical protein BH10ACI3_BH10ACI3_08500 [soil metagenome]
MTRQCPKCNQLNLPEAAFCHNCASPLTPAPTFGAQQQQQSWPKPGAPVVAQGPPTADGPSQRAIIALVLAIAALLCCGPLTGIPAAIVGWMELDAIKKGQSSAAGKWMAMVGLWGGIACTVIHGGLYIIWIMLSLMAAGNPYGY